MPRVTAPPGTPADHVDHPLPVRRGDVVPAHPGHLLVLHGRGDLEPLVQPRELDPPGSDVPVAGPGAPPPREPAEEHPTVGVERSVRPELVHVAPLARLERKASPEVEEVVLAPVLHLEGRDGWRRRRARCSRTRNSRWIDPPSPHPGPVGATVDRQRGRGARPGSRGIVAAREGVGPRRHVGEGERVVPVVPRELQGPEPSRTTRRSPDFRRARARGPGPIR